jgi:hypothetical protein
MNNNPWLVDGLADYERDRIRGELKQIRLAEKALKATQMEAKTNKAPVYRPGVLMRIVLATIKSLIP